MNGQQTPQSTNRRAVGKYFRIAVTAASLSASLFVMALWVRSHYSCDELTIPWSKAEYVHLASRCGSLNFLKAKRMNPWFPGKWSLVAFKLRSSDIRRPEDSPFYRGKWGFGVVRTSPPTLHYYYAPHWWLAALLGLCARIPWLRPRFSLRTLLVATTIIACLLGLLAWTR